MNVLKSVARWLADGSTAEIIERDQVADVVADLAEERRAAIVEALGRFVRQLDLDHEEKACVRKHLDVICADCGPAEESSYNTCRFCGGYAQPVVNQRIDERRTLAHLRRKVRKRTAELQRRQRRIAIN